MGHAKHLAFPAVVLAAAILVSLTGPARAQEDGSPVSIGTYRTLTSQVLNEDRTLLVNLPRGYEESKVDYPVLFVLYGGQVRGYFAEAVHVVDRLQEAGLVPPMIVVGVKNVDRYRDNLPVNRNGEAGGAGRFLQFFTDEVIPFLDRSYRTKDFRMLLGPQAGASFALYSLMEQPGLFGVNIITNPFWNRSVRDYLLAESEAFFSGEGPFESFLFVTCNTGADNEATMQYLDSLAAIVDRAGSPGFTMMLNPAEREDRDIIFTPGLKQGLMAYFKKYKIPEEEEISGLEDLSQYYRDLSEEYGYEVDVPRFAFIKQGDRLQERRNLDGAQVLYEQAVEHYPHNLDSYFRLAELHRMKGNLEISLEYYERFLGRQHESFVEQRMLALRRYVDESAAYAIERAIGESGTDAATARYREIRASGESGLYFSEGEFNTLGYNLLGRGMVDAAIEVFKMNVEMYPESANAYDSLAEAYMLAGDKERAIRNYTRSLELNPDNTNAREKILELREGAGG